MRLMVFIVEQGISKFLCLQHCTETFQSDFSTKFLIHHKSCFVDLNEFYPNIPTFSSFLFFPNKRTPVLEVLIF